jgi:hypothetical protein
LDKNKSLKHDIIKLMATGQSNTYNLPYPLAENPVNVHGDIKQLVEQLEVVLPTASFSQVSVINNSAQAISAGDPVYVTGYTSKTTVAKATHLTTDPILGLAKTAIAIGASGVIVVAGILENINTSSFTAGDILYCGETGGLTTVSDQGGAVGIVVYAAEHGIISIDAKGNGTWGALKAGIA